MNKEKYILPSDQIANFIKTNVNNAGVLTDFLEKIGKLPKDFDLGWAIDLLNHSNEAVRLLAVKNIGKVHTVDYLPILTNVINNDSSTMVKREAVSSIGRMHSTDAIDVMMEVLSNSDPKIVCQAIRGLLVFKGDKRVDSALKALKDHPNEIISKVIREEYFSETKRSYRKKNKENPHPAVFPYLKNVAVNGDVLEVIKYVPEDSIHLTFTSPPYYNARDYSIYESYEAYLSFLEKVFSETYRVTKEGRFFILNTSPVIVPRISRAHSSKRYPISFDLNTILQKIGWEFIDDIIWMKPEYSVKNRIGGFQQHRKPLGYKPNSITEYLMVYRKKSDRLIDWNIHQYPDEIIEDSKVEDGFESTNVWQINPKSDKVHSAIFPEALCERVIKYYSFVGDLIFDPFGGSGTLARVAEQLKRCFFTTENNPKYFQYMKYQNTSILGSESGRYLSLEDFKKSINDPDRSNH